jgi:hypothetical protein
LSSAGLTFARQRNWFAALVENDANLHPHQIVLQKKSPLKIN